MRELKIYRGIRDNFAYENVYYQPSRGKRYEERGRKKESERSTARVIGDIERYANMVQLKKRAKQQQHETSNQQDDKA